MTKKRILLQCGLVVQSHLYNIDTERDAAQVKMWMRGEEKGWLVIDFMWKTIALEYVDIDIFQIPAWLMAFRMLYVSSNMILNVVTMKKKLNTKTRDENWAK